MDNLKWFAGVVLMVAVAPFESLAAESAIRLRESWNEIYTSEDASGKHVMGLWTFDGNEPLDDASGNGHNLKLQGAELDSQGRFGGALLSKPGWPVTDSAHCARCADAPGLSPPDAFTIEMWLCPAAELDSD